MLALAAAPARAALPRLFAGKEFLRLRGGARWHLRAPMTTRRALGRFAGAVDVITYEFENVPAKTAAFLAQRKPVLPDPQVLEITQDRLIEKNFISELKIATAPYAPVHSASQLADAVAARRPAGGAQDPPARLRRQGPGQDRQGRRRCRGLALAVQNAPCILEGFIAFEREVSVVAARAPRRQGRMLRGDRERAPRPYSERRRACRPRSRRRWHARPAASPPASPRPSTMSACWRWRCSWCAKARRHACWSTRSRRACTIPATGPSTARPSRSSSSTSARSPAGRSANRPPRHRVEMTNLIGAEVNEAARWLTVPGASVHLYGKGEARPRPQDGARDAGLVALDAGAS